jgi:hypothetical protein
VYDFEVISRPVVQTLKSAFFAVYVSLFGADVAQTGSHRSTPSGCMVVSMARPS